ATLTIAGTPKVLGLIPTTASVTATTALDAAYKGDDNDTETINVRDYNYVGFDLDSVTLTEGTDSTYSASISSTLVATKPITVNYTVSGTAGAGDTNLSASGSVIIDPTDPETPQQATIDFIITDDTVSELPKSINFTITSVTSLDPSIHLDTTSQDMNITLLDDDDPILTDYRFDECVGTSSIIDSSGNGYDTTGGVSVISGEKLCNAKTFNGATQYITLPSAVSTQLKTSASLSFWIKTTQPGDNTMWLAPGITGVEQSGGGDDVFWGWLDATGHIGILKGNTAGAQSTNPINDGTWKHIVLTRDSTTGSVQVYVNGVLNQTATSETGDVTTAFSRLGSIEDTGGTPTYFNGSLDEVKVFSRVLSSDEVTAIYTNDAALINYDGSTRTCQICITDCTAKYDLYHNYNITLTPAYRLQTRIARQPFDVNITASCDTGTGTIPTRKIKSLYAIDGSASCTAATPKLVTFFTNGTYDINDTNKTITISALNSTNTYSNIKLMVETNASELNCSSDSFAIRPAFYNILSPVTMPKAGNSFDFNLSAMGWNNTAITDYNGTAILTKAPSDSTKSTCPVPDGNLTKSNGSAISSATFISTNSTSTNSGLRFNDVGQFMINLKDSTWTSPDQPNDCIVDSNSTPTPLNLTDKVGCNIENNTSMTIIPDHFDLNATLNNFNQGTFTYLSTDLNMSADLNITVTAQTEGNTTTKNYNTLCYANPTNYTITYTVPTIYPSTNLTKLNYVETNTSTSSNVATTANTFTLSALSKTIFGSDTNGSAKLSVKINFDRNETKPVNPFDLNISSVIVTDTDSVDGNDTTVGNATFVYGRIHAYDIQTRQTSAPNP
ncbi:MAG: LamG-like jellyroll fold domain-containing protein, partial [Sulfuricurvum sp.]|nr:LamG-like jellyroll fold domain-containing protein [Sulfuricurvum sp.]